MILFLCSTGKSSTTKLFPTLILELLKKNSSYNQNAMLLILGQKCSLVENRIIVMVLDFISLEVTTSKMYVDEKD